MNVKYYSPNPDNIFEHAYPPLKFVYTDKGDIQDVYSCKLTGKWYRLSHMKPTFFHQHLHNHCYKELTDEQVFLNSL